MTEKRFSYGANERWDNVLIDNLEKKGYSLYSLDELCNRLWEQTQRFEKHNQELSEENEQLKKQIERIDFILDDLNGAEYISRDDGIKALNKIDKVIGKR